MVKGKETFSNAGLSRNVRRTKMALRNSLVELMKTRSITRIAVKEICDSADVGRSTFYAHYEDQYSLLEEIEMECLAVFEETLALGRPMRKYSSQELTLNIEKTLQFVADNSKSVQILLSENGGVSFQRKFIQRFMRHLKSIIKYYTDNSVNEKRSECYSIFYTNGIIALIQYWLKNDMRIPISEFARIIEKLSKVLRE